MAKRKRKSEPKFEFELPVAEPWEQQADESGPAYEAFRVFLNMGLRRTITGAAKEHADNNTNENFRSWTTRFYNWAARYDWRVRARLKDREDDRLAAIEQRAAVMEMRERHVKLAMTAQAAAQQAIIDYVTTNSKKGKKLTPKDAIRLLDNAYKMERMSRNEPDTIINGGENAESAAATESREKLMSVMLNPDASEHLEALAEMAFPDEGE